MDNLELVTIGKFSRAKLLLGTPEIVAIKDESGKDSKTSYYKCSVGYLNSKKERTDLILEAPKTFCFGVAEEYAFGKPKTPENFKGYQTCYYFSDPDKKDGGMSADQRVFNKTLDELTQALSDHLQENAELLPDAMADLATSGKFVHSVAKYPKKEETITKNGRNYTKKVDDTSKPLRFYARLLFNKKTEKFATKFYGPGDVEMDPRQFIDVRGMIEPALKVEYVYIGASSATYQIKLWECNYTPSESTSRKRLISRNTSQPVAEEDDDDVVPSNESDPNKALESDDDDIKIDDEPVVKEEPKKQPVRRRVPVKKPPSATMS